MITPVLVTDDLISRSAAALVPSRNSFRPLPRCTGMYISRYSSTRSAPISAWASSPLPCTCSSSPGRSLSLPTSVTTSPPSSCELFQSTALSVADATYLGSAFSLLAIGLPGSVTRGQYPAKIWYVLRPSRNALACSNQPVMAAPLSSAPYGADQPPYAKPPDGSSSGPPGACM